MPRYIRYLEKGEYKYASVKEVGDMSLIKTNNKGSLVEAINELIDGGIATIVDGDLQVIRDDVTAVEGTVANHDTTIQQQAVDIQSQSDLYQAMQLTQEEIDAKQAQIRAELDTAKADLDTAKTDLINKADLTYVDGQLVKKVDQDAYIQKYEEIETELSDKIDITQHQTDYDNLVTDINTKADSITVNSQVDELNQSIANQQDEINTAKTDISNVNSDVVSLVNRTSAVEGDIILVNQEVDDVQGELSTTVTKLTNVDGRLGDAESRITQTEEQIELKVSKTEYDTGMENTKNYVLSRGESLVTNGNGFMEDNTNFTDFLFDPVNQYSGKGSFFTNVQQGTRYSDELIPVNPSEKYRFSLMAKSDLGIGRNYFGIVPFDVDGHRISPLEYFASTKPVLQLTQDLKVGDTQIHLDSVDGLIDSNPEDENGIDHHHSLLFWGYKNSYGYEYPVGTYSRDVLHKAWTEGSIDRANNVINLAEPFGKSNPNDPDGVYRVGHKLSGTFSGGSYKYITASNVLVPTDWTYFEGFIEGLGASNNTFPYGTANVRLLFLTNRSTSGGQAGDSLWVDNLSFYNVTQEEKAKNYTDNSIEPIESRLSTAETSITQNETAINLKANQTDVTNALSGKVDTSTYENKISEIEVDVDGITQTVSSQQTEINNLDGTVSSHTSQISTIDQKADAIELRVSETEGDVSGLEGRVSTAETSISANTTAISLKADNTTVNDLDGRVSSAESELQVQAGQISQRVTKTEYDENVGLNKWVVSKYDIDLGDSKAVPKFEHIQGKTPSEIVEFLDAERMQPFSDDYYIAHFFTNVYVEDAKTLTLSITNDDMSTLYLNGAFISENYSYTTPTEPSISLREGWNTVDILFYEHSGSEFIDIGLKLSDHVDKLTAHIGIGNKNDTRLAQAETSIIQTSEAIELKADSTEVTSLGNRITANEGSITVLNDEITSKVSQTDFNAYSQRVSDAESRITQTEESIESKVSQTDYNLLNGRVDTAETNITQLNNSIELKATETSVNNLEGRMSSAESSITANTEAITLKATQTDLNTVTGRLSDAESQIEVQAGQISQTVTKTEFDSLKVGGRNYQPKISDLSGSASSYATYGDYWIEVEYPEIFSSSPYIFTPPLTEDMGIGDEYTVSFDATLVSTIDSQGCILNYGLRVEGSERKDHKSSFSVGQKRRIEYTDVNDSAKGKSEMIYYVSTQGVKPLFRISNIKIEKGSKSTDWTPAPEDIEKDILDLDDRITSAESSITQTSDEIQLRVTKEEFDNLQIGGRNLIVNSELRAYTSYNTNPEVKSINVIETTYTRSGYDGSATGIWTLAVDGFTPKADVYTVSGYVKINGQIPSRTVWGDGLASTYGRALANNEYDESSGRFVITQEYNGSNIWILHKNSKISTGDVIELIDLKFERGSKATDWTRSIEDVEGNISDLDSRITSADTAITQNSENISLKASKTEVYTKGETDTKLGDKADSSDLNALVTRVTSAESEINQSAEQISLRVTKDEFDALDIGGRNIASIENWSAWEGTVENNGYSFNIVGDSSGTNGIYHHASHLDLNPSTQYILSFKVRQINGELTKIGGHVDGTFDGQVYFMIDGLERGGTFASPPELSFLSDGNWHEIVYSFKTPSSIGSDRIYIQLNRGSYVYPIECEIKDIQIEKGSKPTDWTPAPEDVDGDITDLESRMTSAETSITQTSNSISLKADKSTTYTKNEVDNDIKNAIHSTGSWTKSYSVNTDTPSVLRDAKGNVLSDAYSYELQARTTATGTESTAVAHVVSKGDGNGWTLEKVYEIGTSSNHPEFFLDSNGNPALRLYGHTSIYPVEVKHMAYRGRNIPSRSSVDKAKAEIKITTDGIKQDVSGVSSTVSSHGTTLSSHASSIETLQDQIVLKVSSEDVYTKNQTDSKINDISVGGRNLLKGSSYEYQDITVGSWNVISHEGRLDYLDYYGLAVGDTITLRSYIKNLGSYPVCVRTSYYESDNTYSATTGNYIQAGEEGYSEVTMTIPASTDRMWFGFQNGNGGNGTDIPIQYKEYKVEKGNKSTGWSPAPEDVETSIMKLGSMAKVRYIRDWLNGSTSNTGNHWVEIQAIRGEQNVARYKPVTCSSGQTTNIERVTDGNTSTGHYFSAGSGLHYVQVDLGQVYSDLHYLHVLHYYSDGRTYHNTKTQVSEDGENWVTLFDSKHLGEYPETSDGIKLSLNAGSGMADSNKRLTSAESAIELNADNIALKVSKNGVISAINVSPESIELDANKINLNGHVTATHIKSLNGLNVNNQFIVDSGGNVTFKGALNGATGTFSGAISTNENAHIGEMLYVGENVAEGYVGINFGSTNGSAQITTMNVSGESGGLQAWTSFDVMGYLDADSVKTDKIETSTYNVDVLTIANNTLFQNSSITVDGSYSGGGNIISGSSGKQLRHYGSSGNLYVDGGRLEVSSDITTHGQLHTDSNIRMDGDLYFNNQGLISAGSGDNTDHIWHDDGANEWHFVSDHTYKGDGADSLSRLVADRLRLGDYRMPNGYNMVTAREGGTAHENLMLIQDEVVTVNLNGSISSSVTCTFPVAFYHTPDWVVASAVNANANSYNIGIYSISRTGCTIYAKHIDDYAYSGSVQVQVVALGRRP